MNKPKDLGHDVGRTTPNQQLWLKDLLETPREITFFLTCLLSFGDLTNYRDGCELR